MKDCSICEMERKKRWWQIFDKYHKLFFSGILLTEIIWLIEVVTK